MARKPNYQFERMERDRQKALKKAEKQRERERAAAEANPQGPAEPPTGES
jgi:hypothetical protein